MYYLHSWWMRPHRPTGVGGFHFSSAIFSFYKHTHSLRDLWFFIQETAGQGHCNIRWEHTMLYSIYENVQLHVYGTSCLTVSRPEQQVPRREPHLFCRHCPLGIKQASNKSAVTVGCIPKGKTLGQKAYTGYTDGLLRNTIKAQTKKGASQFGI